jgi:hypothetical protein
MIQSGIGLEKLAGVFVDVNDLSNIERPAYSQMKQEILSGEIHRVLILDRSAILGNPAADEDVMELFRQANCLEIFTLTSGKIQPISIWPAFIPLAV